MELFEFVMVLVSIIIGLGITTLLTGVANVLQSRGTIRPYWVHSVAVVLVFLAHIQVWWESWGLNSAPEWSFVGLVVMLGTPICLFLISHLMFPDERADVDLSEYYFEMARVVWLIGAAATLIGTFSRSIAFGSSVLDPGNFATIPTLAICLLLAWTQDRRVHSVLVPALLILIWFDTILIAGVQG